MNLQCVISVKALDSYKRGPWFHPPCAYILEDVLPTSVPIDPGVKGNDNDLPGYICRVLVKNSSEADRASLGKRKILNIA